MKKLLPAILTVVIILGAYGIYWYGTKEGKQANQSEIDKLAPIVENAFPKPNEVLNVTNAKVTGVYGATIALSVGDPEDYLPHTDGTPRKTIVRYATVTPKTVVTIESIYGSSKTVTVKDVKVGSAVTVRTESNIRTAEKFDASEVRVMEN